MEVLLAMRNQVYRTKNNSIFILNLFALQLICLIALNRLGPFYIKIAQLVLITVDDKWTFYSILVLGNLCFSVAVVLLFIIIQIWRSWSYRQYAIQLLGTIVLNFKYCLLIPVACINVKPLILPEVEIMYKAFCSFNIVVTFALSASQLYTNWSNRFIEKDYCNRRQNSIICLFLQFGFGFSTIIFGNFVGSFFLIGVSFFRAYQVSITVEYMLIQESTLFYCGLNIYMCFIFLFGEGKISFLDMTCKIVIGIVSCNYFAKNCYKFINICYSNSETMFHLNRGQTSTDLEKQASSEPEIEHDNHSNTTSMDTIVFSRILLSKMRTLKNGKDPTGEWEMWWQKYEILIINHKLGCTEPKCCCKFNVDENAENQIVLEEMRKMIKTLEQDKIPDSRIMTIYLNIEILNKPLKAYYEIVRLQSEDISVTNKIDLECLLIETRKCFAQVFLKNNIKNSSLQLLKVIKFEEIIESLEEKMKNVLESTITFNELFTLSSIKIHQLTAESKKINELKQKIGEKIEDLVMNFPDSFSVSFFIYIFYQHLDVYRSKQKQLKTISQEKNLKRRLFEREDEDIFSTDFGVIYIDLVQERGKIKKITKNLCEAFGHNYEDMINYNINQFMPYMFSKYHYKFLINFVEFGKIKILADKKRFILAKNKNKFIFPIVVRMKTQHLLDNEFGVTALVKKIVTQSQFMLFGPNGRIEEVSEKIYNILFSQTLRSEVDKTRRLCLVKMIPNLTSLIDDLKLDEKVDKIYEAPLIFSTFGQTLQKFRTYRENRHNDSSHSNSYVNGTMEGEMTTNEMSMNGIGLGPAYYAEVFKSFLNDLNIIKLNALIIRFKLSKMKTEEFSIFLLEIVSFEVVKSPLDVVIEEYKRVAEFLNIYEEYGSINQNFKKYRNILERNDVLNFMLNKNIESQNYNKKQIKSARRPSQRKKVLIMDDQEDKNHTQTIPDSSIVQDFNDINNNMMNQQQFNQRGGSERSSITDQTQSQSKKQMLINAFNADTCRVSTKFLFLFNILAIAKICILVVFIIKAIDTINGIYSSEVNELTKIRMKQIFQFRLAIAEIDQFYKNALGKKMQVSAQQINQIPLILKRLNTQFTDVLTALKQIGQNPSQNNQILMSITIYDTYLQQNTQISIIQLLSQLDYLFRNDLTQEGQQYLEINYIAIHQKFYQLCFEDILKFSSQENIVDIMLIMLGIYETVLLFLVLLWVPILYLVSKEEKRIINLLTSMNIKELKISTEKLRLIAENIKQEKAKQVSHLISLLNDEKIENALEMQKDKSMTRNIKLVEENGCYSIKPNFVAAIIVIVLIFFSLLPVVIYQNVSADEISSKKTQGVIQQASFLADKAPTLINIYLSNVNKIYNNENLLKFPLQIYNAAANDYFNLTLLISQADQITSDLISNKGLHNKFSGPLCQEIECLSNEKPVPVRFYDEIAIIRNKFMPLSPGMLNIQKPMSSGDIDKWVTESSILYSVGWINKIYLFITLWNNRFQEALLLSLDNTKKILIIMVSILIPLYVIGLILMQVWMTRKMSKILQNAQSVHMHFPVGILAKNTYLTSYFNQKIKNSK